MDSSDLPDVAQRLAAGFDGLQTEYEKLYGQYRALESKLSVAREQYNELAKLLGKSTNDTTPPLSYISTNPACAKNEERPLSVTEIFALRKEHDVERLVRNAIEASAVFKRQSTSVNGVKIWSGPSADTTTSSKLPSITESPMEQDFTVVGVPSKLGCPFASMSGKKLSNHAASVLSRYHGAQSPRDGQSSIRDTGSAVGSLNSRLNGRESVHGKSRRLSSLPDPIKAEICGMDSHDGSAPARESVPIEEAAKAAEPGVCPIRFLNQHSPEELAQYFEKHKHELPRSHEVCVKRYQGNEQQVRELDAKYSNVAQMIKGLGERHQDFLPKDIDDEPDEPQMIDTDASNGKVERWANSLSPGALTSNAAVEKDDDNRESHFARPLPDVRLGESPSRPWGIRVPQEYLEETKSNASSAPVQINTMPADHPPVGQAGNTGKCPFAAMQETAKAAEPEKAPVVPVVPETVHETVAEPATTAQPAARLPLIFNGPVIIGYGADEAARFLQNLSQSGQA